MSDQQALQCVFRVDSSNSIGRGHLARCLTMAKALRHRGHNICFICAKLPGHAVEWIERAGFSTQLIDAYSLPDNWQADAKASIAAIKQLLGGIHVDWLVLDHYQLASNWQTALRQVTRYLLTIDDLANRPLDTDLLLDTGIGKQAADYQDLIPAGCVTLMGTDYALLATAYSQHVSQAKNKRLFQGQAEKPVLLVSFGSTDPMNLLPVLLPMLQTRLPNWTIDVVLGSAADNLEQVRQVTKHLEHCQLHVDSEKMADFILAADLAIGGAGITAYERCVLGLPSVILAVANNQQQVARQLEISGAVKRIEATLPITELLTQLVEQTVLLAEDDSAARQMAQAAFALVDAQGVTRVVKAMETHNSG